jgi:hypothetical protein
VKAVANDNEYQSSDFELMDKGIISQYWYYKHLDKKGKRPDYLLIQALSQISLFASVVGIAGSVDGMFFNKEVVTEALNDLEEDSLTFIYSIYRFCEENSSNEFRFLAGHIIQKLMGDWMHSAVEQDLTKQIQFEEWYAENRNTHTFEINKEDLCKFYNETPQRIRKGLDVLSNLDLIKYQHKNNISLNNDLIETILQKDVAKIKGGQNE